MLCNALLYNRKHRKTWWENAEWRKLVDTRVCIHVYSCVEILKGGEDGEPLVMIGCGTASLSGRRQAR
jgi:hypothetical protein